MALFSSDDPGRYHRSAIPALWSSMRLQCWECGEKFTQRVCMEEPATDCPRCGAEVKITLPKEPRMRR
jgi:rRNA maturation endonuclease Nob1